MKTTVTALADRLRTEADAWEYLESLRWPNDPICPKCKGTDVALIRPRNGVSRQASGGSMSQRRTWNCRECRRMGLSPQFTATTGTIMHGTRIPLRTWVLVFFEMASSKNGVAALEVERKYGLCSRSAWFMLHRIREAMRSGSTERFVGTVVADEAYIGGDPKNRHAWQRVGGKDGRGTDKAPVVSLLNAATGEVRSRVVTNVDGMTLGRFILENADPTGGTLVTDSFRSYGPIGEQFAKHEQVDHTAGEYVRDGFSTNRVECFYSQLKRSIDGTHHHVSDVHLHRYVSEHDFRYSTCKASDADRMTLMVEQVEGRRLTYRRVAAA